MPPSSTDLSHPQFHAFTSRFVVVDTMSLVGTPTTRKALNASLNSTARSFVSVRRKSETNEMGNNNAARFAKRHSTSNLGPFQHVVGPREMSPKYGNRLRKQYVRNDTTGSPTADTPQQHPAGTRGVDKAHRDLRSPLRASPAASTAARTFPVRYVSPHGAPAEDNAFPKYHSPKYAHRSKERSFSPTSPSKVSSPSQSRQPASSLLSKKDQSLTESRRSRADSTEMSLADRRGMHHTPSPVTLSPSTRQGAARTPSPVTTPPSVPSSPITTLVAPINGALVTPISLPHKSGSGTTSEAEPTPPATPGSSTPPVTPLQLVMPLHLGHLESPLSSMSSSRLVSPISPAGMVPRGMPRTPTKRSSRAASGDAEMNFSCTICWVAPRGVPEKGCFNACSGPCSKRPGSDSACARMPPWIWSG